MESEREPMLFGSVRNDIVLQSRTIDVPHRDAFSER